MQPAAWGNGAAASNGGHTLAFEIPLRSYGTPFRQLIYKWDFEMKRFLVVALLAIAPLLLPEGVTASKMHPGYMTHGNFRGLNANTNCRRPSFNICQGCNVDIRMRVAANRQCGFNFQSLGPFAGQEVTVPPRNGTYSLVNESKAVYRPNTGYTGRDHFEARLYFEEGSGKRTFLNMRVNVLVDPNMENQSPSHSP
ncbi:hypothetical protein [Bradyrhizobium sp.]|uniref:hypothetical protein n=1 Tax=Bradyrhizobium sp. TaxID=376 RepID=UPI0025BF4CD1|nr:hypothetical protein [Bradyrhizobium sp.]